ncbi:MAG: phosphate ABC transporter permease subunit PstC [Firmicutes bacterium]|nr:phosphate ABC transporter permease subunit PstC [Bacillota bacterium]
MDKSIKNTGGQITPKYLKLREGAAKGVFILSSAFSVIALLSIFVFLCIRGLPAIAEIGFFNFLFGTSWHPIEGAINESYGIMPMLLTTLAVTLFAAIGGILLGLSTALFIFKFCPKKVVPFIKQLINLLAGIPSVIYGLFGLMLIVPILRAVSSNFVGHGILAASIILSIMVLPTIVAISLNALYAVPKHIYEGALALGGTKEQALFKAVVPAAKNGIIASIVLAIARAIGETMAVIMVIGGTPDMPTSLFQSLETMTAIIARNAGYADGLAMEALIAIGVVLFLFSLIINFVFMAIKSMGERKLNDEKAVKKGVPVLGHIRFGIVWFFSKIAMGLRWGFSKIKASIRWFFCVTRIVTGWEKMWDKIENKWTSSSRAKAKFMALRMCVYLFAAIALAALIGIIMFVLMRGVPHLNLNFLFGEYSLDAPTLRPAIIGTLMLIGIALSIAAPIGVGTAIFLSEYASKSKFTKYIRVAVETLAGIPSIVYGLFGFIMFAALFGWGFSMLGGGITLSIMILPVIIRTTEESLLSVPKIYREGSFAIGAGKVRTTFRVVLPSAAGGIVSSLILAIGRIIGESAALLLTIGLLSTVVPNSVLSGGTSLSLAVYYYGSFFPDGQNYAAAAAVVLLILVVVLNLIASFVGRLLKKGKGGF